MPEQDAFDRLTTASYVDPPLTERSGKGALAEPDAQPADCSGGVHQDRLENPTPSGYRAAVG